MSILEVSGLRKVYTSRLGGSRVEALRNVSFTVEQGEYVAIMGESGSGKTTLLNILAALDEPTAGTVRLDGHELGKIRERDAAAFRRDNLGFVFQEFNLLDTFTLEDNIYLPLVLMGMSYEDMRARLLPIARELGLTELLKKYPYEVSGGQKQRAAVARAIITEPKLLLADEPTGALDSGSTDELLRLFAAINRAGQTILMVTHSVKAASRAGRVLFIKDGQVFHETTGALRAGDRVHGEIDWDRRFSNMQNHSGEHLVSGLIHQTFGYDNVGFHMGRDEITIDFNGPIGPDQLLEIERRANRMIWENLPIAVMYPSGQELASMDYRSKKEIEGLMTPCPCPACQGKRLRPEALAVTVGGKSIYDATTLPVDDALAFFDHLDLTGNQQIIAAQILKEIHARLGFLQSVGLSYLTLSRASGTLSGGESQRIRLATQIGSSLMGVLYILDEPSIGLHQRDNDKLLATLQRLRDLGNTLIVVEHDEDTMRAADYLIDIGPGAGALGGQVVACGTPEEVMANPDSLTGQYLSGKRTIPLPAQRRRGNGRLLTVRGARENNLKHIDVSIPLGTFTCVTGVSGSGKSSLINEVLFKALGAALNRMKVRPGKHDAIEGMEQLDKVIAIDQSPIGRTPRSNPATYTNLFNLIRDLFASTPDAKARGYGPGRFSFNTKGGRCEACGGDGMLKIEMHFLSDVYVPCEICRGKRYNRETLEVRYKGKNIADVLDMTVDEAWEFFSAVPAICDKLATLRDVGLGYVKLGQPSTELSGGEAQRVKLATELSRRATGRTVYILDEPTTGLHADDVRKLLEVLQRLTDGGNTVLVIEHNLDVIKCADYIIDLGPEGGVGGGTVVACGTPEEIAACPASYTGQYLKKYLK